MRNVLSVTAAALLCSACRAPSAPSSSIALTVAGHQVTAEIAATEAEHKRGLQHRAEVPDGRGMLSMLCRHDFDSRPASNSLLASKLSFNIIYILESAITTVDLRNFSESPKQPESAAPIRDYSGVCRDKASIPL